MEDQKSFAQELAALSPLDGRYKKRLLELNGYVSEYALIKTRVEVEVKYLIALSENKIAPSLKVSEKKLLISLYKSFSLKDAENVKTIEEKTRHDVKAVERFLRNILQNTSLKNSIEMIHFGLTSEDINNISYRLILKRATEFVIIPKLKNIIDWLTNSAMQNKSLPMLARTHGQPAVPTTLGKELVIFAHRLHKELIELKNKTLTGKLNGAVGNYNALYFVYPKIDWIKFSEKFINSLSLEPNLITTQINTYEDIVSFSQNIHRINSILLDFDKDMWRYISDKWFTQIAKKGEVGSSTMPQKVNPIDFENSEGNLGMANALLEHLSRKLPLSRLQRDLTDSTTMRNIGSVLGYCLLGYTSVLTGLTRVAPNKKQITKDLESDWSILTEAVQTLLRKENVVDPYSLIASLTRGEHIDKNRWKKWISEFKIPHSTKKMIENLAPQNYIGLAEKLTEITIKKIRSETK